ncbi:hypothetical protein [Candidatus Korobacter versatilis]|nr:hypothetical protein [Candidatus Koribacter versatilis]
MMMSNELITGEDGTAIMGIRRRLHDLSNVLTGLLITAGLLKNFVPLTGNGGRYADDLEASAERAAVLVNEVREDVHRLQALLQERSESTIVCDVRPSLGQESGEN